MLANNVQESTVTTGTGDITLDGSSENGETFTSHFATNERFRYFWDDRSGIFEEGIGYLSGGTTLVREYPLNGSSAVPVSIPAGTKQVFIAPSSDSIYTPMHGQDGVISGPWVCSSTFAASWSGGGTVTANQTIYTALDVNWTSAIDGFVVLCDSSVGSSADAILCGIYHRLPDGSVGDLVVQASSKFDPSITTDQVISCTETKLPPGRYFSAIWSDVAARYRSPIQSSSTYPGMGWTANNGNFYTYIYGNVSSLTSLPTTPTTPTAGTNNARPAAFRLRTVD